MQMTSGGHYAGSEDPRRALGRGNGPLLPKLQLNEGALEPDLPSENLDSASHAFNNRPRGLSIAIPPTPHSPTSPSADQKRFRRPTISRNRKSPQRAETPRGLVENRKLLAHLLEKLENRESGPDLLSMANMKAKETVNARRTKDKGTMDRIGKSVVAAAQSGISVGQGPTLQSKGEYQEDEDGELESGSGNEQHTAAVYDLVDQTRDLLVLAHRQGLQLFQGGSDTHYEPYTPSKAKSKGGRLSALTSPVATRTHASPSRSAGFDGTSPSHSLHRRLLDILHEMIADDCLHQIALFRPSQPPNALQAASLDIATFLFHTGDHSTQVELVAMVVDGLYTMPASMTERVCLWVEARLSDLLVLVSAQRGISAGLSTQAAIDTHSTAPTTHRLPTFTLSPGDSLERPQGHAKSFGVPATQSLLYDVDTDIFRMSGLLAKVIQAVCATIDAQGTKSRASHTMRRILSIVCKLKADAHLDLLEVVATGSRAARSVALEVLHATCPKSMGHSAIARRIPIASRPDDPTIDQRQANEHPQHHYIPWRISSHDSIKDPHNRCLVCESEIHGLCVRCVMCTEQCHLHCLRTPAEVFTYEIIHLSHTGASPPGTVLVKFSQVPSSPLGRPDSTRTRVGSHRLRLVNLFTTTTCGTCQLPIWGSSLQAFGCLAGCQRMYHPHCTTALHGSTCRPGQNIMINEFQGQSQHPFMVDMARLRQTFEVERSKLCRADSDLPHMSFDEVAVLYGALWTQYKVFESGIAAGTIVVDGKEGQIDLLDLRPHLKAYESFLKSNTSKVSTAASDFANIAGAARPLAQGYLFSRHFVTYCTALLRSSPQESPDFSHSNALLNPFDEAPDSTKNDHPGAVEMLPFTTIRAGLASDLSLHDSTIASIFLDHLDALGLCVKDERFRTYSPSSITEQWGCFSLPLLMDATPSVEILIVAIEVLLDDLDLSFNEQALILLTTRAWPSLLCSPYALERLGGAVISWVMNEDECLHQVIKRYAARNRPLPGVRSTTTADGAYGGTSSVPAYTSDRGRILDAYVVPWLTALHQLDHQLYVHMLYEQSEVQKDVMSSANQDKEVEMAIIVAETALDRLLIAVDAKIMFGYHSDIIIAWLEDLGDLASRDHPYRALPRLLDSKDQNGNSAPTDIWSSLTALSDASKEDHARVCLWLRVLAVSGTPIPWELYQHLAGHENTSRPSLSTLRDLTVVVGANKSPAEVMDYAEICCQLFELLTSSLVDNVNVIEPTEIENDAMRRGLLLVLKAYGTPDDDIDLTSLANSVTGHASVYKLVGSVRGRRENVRAAQTELKKSLIRSVISLLVNSRLPASQLIDFLWLISSRATFAANVDGFLYETGLQVFETLWPMMGSEAVRPQLLKVLLRLLSINSLPLEDFVRSQILMNGTATRERLLHFLLGLMNAQATGDHSSSTTGAVGLILILFEDALDTKTTSADVLAALGSLLPTQLAIVSTFFSDHLTRSDDETRVLVLNKLSQIRTAIPSWPILPWKTIEELLSEQVAAVAQISSWRRSQIGSVLSETMLVRASLLRLGLDMLASGIAISWSTAQRFQQHVASACALPWSAPSDGIVNLILPALRQVLDAPRHLTKGGQNKRTVLVGSLFVPVIVDFANELRKHDYFTQRCLLDLLHVTLYKQETKTVELAILGTLQTVADYASTPVSTENRLLALRILQTAIARIDHKSLVRVSPPIFMSVAKAFVDELSDSGDSSIVEATRSLLKSMIKIFGQSGLFIQIFKVDAVNGQWTQDQSTLKDALKLLVSAEGGTSILEAMFADVAEVLKRDPDGLQHMLVSLSDFVTVNDTELPEDAAEHLGMLITRVIKLVAEWDAASFDPNHLLTICRHCIDKVPPVSTPPLLHQTSTLLLVALSRFNVHFDTLDPLLKLTRRLSNQYQCEDTVQIIVFEEIVGRAMRGPDMTPTSITSVLRCVLETLWVDPASRSASRAMSISMAVCVALLARQHPVYTMPFEPEISLSLLGSAASLLLKAEETDPGTLSRHLSSFAEESAQARCELSAHLLLVEPPSSTVSSLYPNIARSTSICLRAVGDYLSVTDAHGDGADMLTAMFNLIRLVMLSTDIEAIEVFWDRTTPDWNRLLTISTETTCVNTPLRTVCHSIFLDIIVYLDTIGSSLLSTHNESIANTVLVIETWMKGHSGSGKAKLDKAKDLLRAVGQESSSFDAGRIRAGIKADMLVSEKIKMLRSRR